MERVIKNGVIRCGYIVYSPYVIKDPNTSEFSGLAYDYTNALAAELDLKVEWVEETGWGSFHEGLNTGRYDMMCVPVWQGGQRARVSLLTRPAFYNMMHAFVRESDARFDGQLSSINSADITVATIDGDITQNIRKNIFPLTKELALPQAADSAQRPLAIVTKKADVFFDIKNNVDLYNKNAKDGEKLKTAANGEPVRRFGNSYAVKIGETGLKNMLDSAIEAINASGEAQIILNKYPEAGFVAIADGYHQSTE